MLINLFTDEANSSDMNPKEQRVLLEKPSLDRVAVIILAGGKGERLMPLTKTRCKPAISFGGRYRLVDVPISHSLSTGLRHIFVIGQYLAYTLQKHLLQTYFNRGIGSDSLQFLVPEEREGQKVWYKGTADAIRQNLAYFSEIDADYFLVLSGDQLYNINFQQMIDHHIQSEAGLTIAAKPVKKRDATRMGLLRIDHKNQRLIDFVEKPKEAEVLNRYHTDDESLIKMGYQPAEGHNYLGSMGIYLFNREVLFNLLVADEREDFGKHLITTQMKKGDVGAYLYDGYWEDIGTIESYYEANLALTKRVDDPKLELECYDEKNVILTTPYTLPGAKIANTLVSKSLLCEGTLCEAAEISHSVIGVRSVIGKGSIIEESILMGNEFYSKTIAQKSFEPTIGSNCIIKKAIIDENVKIGRSVKLINRGNHLHYDPKPDEPLIFVHDGIIIVPKGTTLPDHFTF